MGEHIHQDAIKAAALINPTHYLESAGFNVHKEGRHYSVRDSSNHEVYRLTKKDDGRFLFCDKTGSIGGDNIKLVMTVSRVSFVDAVRTLMKADVVYPSSDSTPSVRIKGPADEVRQPPRLPPVTDADMSIGRDYLVSRGISRETIAYAEHNQMVRYCNGGVLFCGYGDDGSVQNVTKRATNINDAVQKRDFKGSDKSYPAVLPGIPQKVWIVEGGCDALALRDIALRQGDPPPTIIVSGGANAVSFLKTPHIKAILSQAEKITIAHENEKSEEAQMRTDAAHHKQGAIAAGLTTGHVTHWKPHAHMGKDIAEVNMYFLNKAKLKQQSKQPQHER